MKKSIGVGTATPGYLTNKLLIRMKLLALLFFGFVFQSSAMVSHSQQRINIDVKNTPVENVFKLIERKSDYRFVYGKDVFNTTDLVNVFARNATIDYVMEMLLKGTGLSYKKFSDNLVIVVGTDVQTIQAVQVTGRVTDEQGNPLSGVSIIEKGTTNGVVTNEGGNFSINVRGTGSVLVITSVGYQQKEVAVGNSSNIEISLTGDVKTGDEVVVVGYGTQKRQNQTSSVASVKMDRVLADRPVTSTSQALQGAVSGLQITYGSGQPGTGTSLNIRGYTSINGGGQPLVVVDNVPMSIDDVNPKDIAEVTVLKDAAAAAIYGARAAFGVIIITTKKGGRNQPVKFEYSTNIASTRASTFPKKPSPLQFVSALNDFGTTTYWTGQDIPTWLDQLKQYQADPSKFPDGLATVNSVKYPLAQTDLYGSFFKQGFEQLHNFSFSGGSEKTSYRSSFSYTNQDGIIVSNNDTYKKYNFSTFFNTELTKKLTASVNIFYNNDAKKTPANYGQLFYNAITFGPYAPTGSGTLPGSTEILPYSSPNNLATIESPFQESSNNLRMFGKLEYSLLKNLKVTGEYTFTQANYAAVQVRTTNRYVNPLSFQLDIPYITSSYNKYTSATNNNALNVYASYSLNIADAHSVALMAGTNQEVSKQSGYGANRLNLITPTVPSISTSTGTTTANDDFNEYAVSGYFYRLNYGYKNKYLLEATGRYDGSSRFPQGHRFGFFPAASAGWVITEEPFMQSVKNVFSLLKLRGSYGTIGNQVIYKPGTTPPLQDYYPATPGMNPQNAGWIDPSTNIVFTTLAAPLLVSNNFTWEQIRTTNVGLDWAALNRRLTGSFDVYKEETLGMLGTGSSLPAIIGAAPPKQNRADLRVNGWDMQILWNDKVNSKLSYSIGLNLNGRQPALITKYNNPSKLLSDYYEGQRINEIWGFVTQGYFTNNDFVTGALNDKLINNGSIKQNNGLNPGIAGYKGVLQSPGDIRFVDLNGDSVIFTGQNTVMDPGDRKIIGNSTRRLQYGVNGSIAYGNFDFSFFVQGIGKRDVWISNQVFFPYQNQFSAIYAHQLDYWMPTNTNAYYPRSYANASGPTGTSESVQTKYLSNGAYLRVKSLAAGFTFPQVWISKLHIERARIFFSGENLFTFDHLSDGLDPESSNLGSGGIYPFLKKYSFGININF